MTLGGFTMIKDGDSLDYCWRECIASLLPVCEQVAVCVAQGADGTEAAVREWVAKEPKLSINIYPWPNPKGDSDFFVTWIQYARAHTMGNYVLQLDADEVLSEKSYPEIERLKERKGKFSVWCQRYNFWRDAQSLIPHGVCCAHRVVRIAPQEMWLPSDGPHPLGAGTVNLAIDSGIEIFHYGFLRRPEAFFKKAKALQGYFFDSYDPRLAKAESYEGNWAEMPGITDWENRLEPFKGEHPQVARGWLKERGRL